MIRPAPTQLPPVYDRGNERGPPRASLLSVSCVEDDNNQKERAPCRCFILLLLSSTLKASKELQYDLSTLAPLLLPLRFVTSPLRVVGPDSLSLSLYTRGNIASNKTNQPHQTSQTNTDKQTNKQHVNTLNRNQRPRLPNSSSLPGLDGTQCLFGCLCRSH